MKKVPDDLGDRGAMWYKRMTKQYKMRAHELEALRTAASCLDRIGQAQQSITNEGLLTTDTRGAMKKNPACEVEATNKKIFMDYCKTMKIFSEEGKKDEGQR
jgi:hypothetical protein